MSKRSNSVRNQEYNYQFARRDRVVLWKEGLIGVVEDVIAQDRSTLMAYHLFARHNILLPNGRLALSWVSWNECHKLDNDGEDSGNLLMYNKRLKCFTYSTAVKIADRLARLKKQPQYVFKLTPLSKRTFNPNYDQLYIIWPQPRFDSLEPVYTAAPESNGQPRNTNRPGDQNEPNLA